MTWLIASWLWLSGVTFAAPEVHHVDQVGLAYKPAGLQYLHETELRFKLYNSDHMLFKDSHIATGYHFSITPAFPRTGPYLHFEPIAMWDMTLRATVSGYWGAFSMLVPLDGPDATGSPAERNPRIDDGLRTPGWDLRLDARTRLKAKVGPVVTVFEAEWRKHRTRGLNQDILWHWDATDMLVIEADGVSRMLSNYTFFVIRDDKTDPKGRKLWVGPVTFWAHAPSSGDTTVRSGPMMFWRANDNPRTPQIVAGSLFWWKARFIQTGVPYVVLAAQWEH